MDKAQIREILQSCLLALDGADLDYIIKSGLVNEPKLAKMGLQLYSYLEKKS